MDSNTTSDALSNSQALPEPATPDTSLGLVSQCGFWTLDRKGLLAVSIGRIQSFGSFQQHVGATEEVPNIVDATAVVGPKGVVVKPTGKNFFVYAAVGDSVNNPSDAQLRQRYETVAQDLARIYSY